MTKLIPLRLSGGADATYKDWPVTQGIAFADATSSAIPLSGSLTPRADPCRRSHAA